MTGVQTCALPICFPVTIRLPTRYRVKDCSVENWFEKNTYAYKQIDFFTAGVGMEYETDWSDNALGSAWREKSE